MPNCVFHNLAYLFLMILYNVVLDRDLLIISQSYLFCVTACPQAAGCSQQCSLSVFCVRCVYVFKAFTLFKSIIFNTCHTVRYIDRCQDFIKIIHAC